MTLRIFMHLRSKRAETVALLDLGATENFMNLKYAKYLHLPIKTLQQPRKLFNVDGTQNRAGELKYYINMNSRTGKQQTNLRYFLTDLGEHKVILGYPWFATTQPKIDWAWGWIDHSQLPTVRWHRRIVNEVLTILENNNLYLNIDKCEFKQDHIDFLGVHIENNQMKIEEGKIDKVKN